MRRQSLYIICLLCAVLLQFSCKDDAYTYPPVQLEFVCAHMDETGTVDYFLNDDGKAYYVDNAARFTKMLPDTVYRMICNYEVLSAASSTSKGNALVYALQQTVSVIPISEEKLVGDMKTDPVEVQSIWKKSAGYINMVLLVKSQDGKHLFHFIENGIADEGGHKKLSLTLYHDKANDTEAYTKNAYLSVPLDTYKDVLTDGDLIDFHINTRSGMKTYSFTY